MRRLGVALGERRPFLHGTEAGHSLGFDPLLTIVKHLDTSALVHLELFGFPIIPPRIYLDPQIIQLFKQVEILSMGPCDTPQVESSEAIRRSAVS